MTRREGYQGTARARLHLVPTGSICPDAAVSASGPLVALRHEGGGFEARPGDTTAAELRVRFL
jgi:hypothetical protein